MTCFILNFFRRLLYKYTECFKKVGLPVFDIPKQVLRLVYGECLIWWVVWLEAIKPSIREWFSNEWRKTKTKVITLANQKRQRQSSEPIKTRIPCSWRKARENEREWVMIDFGQLLQIGWKIKPIVLSSPRKKWTAFESNLRFQSFVE